MALAVPLSRLTPLVGGGSAFFVRLLARMDIFAIKSLVETELARGESFTNYHGITPATIRSFLVEPFTARTDPDDLETQPRDMWVVLQDKQY